MLNKISRAIKGIIRSGIEYANTKIEAIKQRFSMYIPPIGLKINLNKV